MKNRIGERFLTKENYWITIIEYPGVKNCSVQFENGLILRNIEYCQIQRGNIKNPYHPSVCGIGYVGEGDYKSKIGGKKTKVYNIWSNIIKRCYSENQQKRQPTYVGCSVDERWHNFQVFAEWFEQNYKEDYQLDKDILFKGNKIYSPETCRFVPQEVNKVFIKRQNYRGNYPIGVCKVDAKFVVQTSVNGEREYIGVYKTPLLAFYAYKRIKEKEIKSIANLCKSILLEEIYEAMINYQVEITD